MKPPYIIQTGSDVADLAEAVNKAIKKGYRPLGGPVSVRADELGQALIIPERERKKA